MAGPKLSLVAILAAAGVAIGTLALAINRRCSKTSKPSIQSLLKCFPADCRHRLEPYFTGLTLEDLTQSTASEVIDCASAHDRLLMKAFVHKFLSAYFETTDQFAEFADLEPVRAPPCKEHVAFVASSCPSFSIDCKGRADLRHRMVSSRFDPSFARNGVVRVRDLDLHLREASQKRAAVKVLDCSRNNIFLEDFVHIEKACAEQPQCEVLDVAFNRIWVTADKLDVLRSAVLNCLDRERHPALRFLNLSANPCAGIELKGMLSALADEQLSRLIWIPRQRLEALNWSVAVDKDAHKVPIVLKAHHDYYQSEFYLQAQ